MKLNHVDDDTINIPTNTQLLAFSESPAAENENDLFSLECQVAVYVPKSYVKWYNMKGQPVLHVVYWATVNDMFKLIQSEENNYPGGGIPEGEGGL